MATVKTSRTPSTNGSVHPHARTPARRTTSTTTPAESLLAMVVRTRKQLRDLADDLVALQQRPNLRPGIDPMSIDTAEVYDAVNDLHPLEDRLREIIADARHVDTSGARLARWGVGSNVGGVIGGNAGGASAGRIGGAS